MHARATHLRFPPAMRREVVRVVQGLVPILETQQGFRGLNLLTDPDMVEGIIVSFWESETDVQSSETSASYIGQMSMLSSFLHEPMSPKTYEANTRA